MQDKTMTANARKILLVTASAFCLASAGAYLGNAAFKRGSEGSNERDPQTQSQEFQKSQPRP
ncbi:hypothetical protein AZSI13_32040 [Azospira sp. I13]|uniref:hypothetical protein n=1 Tax=Azospira sp. I13 TaxID=1765050 RepID=UPI000D4DF81D|nr:hypothetical protein [Azospira sp. I13]GBG03877.1 hypothetical protein AZSI13_32040 [Azospira sp. I13]